MRSLAPLLFAFFAAAACGGSSSGSLQGPGSFAPNAAVAARDLGDAGIVPFVVEVILGNSSPAFTCTDFDAGVPASAIVNGEVNLLIAQAPTLQAGTFSITDPMTLETADVPAAGFAAVQLFGPTSPPGNSEMETETSVSGSLTLTKVGDEWAGSFTATMVDSASASSTLTGTFDTSNICETKF
jgi:hypothetical protein